MPEFVLRRVSVVLVMLFAFISPLASMSASAQADELTCDDFTNQDAAQIVVELDETLEDALEVDADGLACPDLPARDASGGPDAADVELAIGTDIADFEEVIGDPDDDADADDFAVGTVYPGYGDYDSVSVFWLNDTAAHIQVELSEELDESDALDEALTFLPTTAELDEASGEELDSGETLFTGVSDEVADLFTAADYEEYEVGGDPGDVRVILIPGTADFAVIDIAIGLGEEYVSGGGTDPDPDPTEESSGDADEYLATVRESTDQMTQDLTDFTELLANADSLTDADIDDLLAILNRWIALEAEAAALTAPDGLEEIQSTYEDAAAALADVSLNFSSFITEEDDAALDQAFESLAEATSLVAELDKLLTDEGA